MLKHIKGFKIEDRKSHATIALQVLPIQFSDDEATKRIVIHNVRRLIHQPKAEIQELAYK